jgi:hypothetical protein
MERAETGVEVRTLCDEQAVEAFDKAARHYLGISGEQFVRAWESGEFEETDRPDVMRVAMLLPLAG